MATCQPIPMAKATPHGPGEIDSTSLIGWYAFLYPLSVRTALRKKEDRSILQRIDLSLSGARQEVVSQAAARQTLSVQQDLELPGPTTAAAPRQQPACTPPDRYHEGGALQAPLWALGRRTNAVFVASRRELKYWHEPITLRYFISS